ncbi:PcfJ domain-containing protein [Rhodopseudomonas parapalustris]
MSKFTWTRLKADAASKLTAACPALASRDTDLSVLATVVALADTHLSTKMIAGALEPKLLVSPKPRGDAIADSLLAVIATPIYARVSQPDGTCGPCLGDWVEVHGFAEMSLAVLASATGLEELNAAAAIVADAIRKLSRRTAELALAHLGDVLERDLHAAATYLPSRLTSPAVWLLAPETSGDPSRGEILKRRLQAMTIYGALSGTLISPEVTRAIDDATPLAPILMQRHDLDAAELRALRGARSFRRSVTCATDFHVAVQELKAHEVAQSDWPGAGRPEHPDAWENCVWTTSERQSLLRPDYLGSGAMDAIDALRTDLLRPLAAQRIRVRATTPSHDVLNFERTIALEAIGGEGSARQRLLRALRQAIVGNRRHKAFQEAVALWHRRVASLSALRHERQADRPGWPPLCAPWRSSCGRFEIAVLASAADLVEEGNALDHCVGGYYEICRRGDTQILSIRDDGQRVATVELRLGPDLSVLTLEVGQFRSRRNASPGAHLHDPLRAFLRDIRAGVHPVEAAQLARYRKRMRETWDGIWRSDALSIAHAREVFPFYLALLPRDTPHDFDAWCERSGLSAAIDGAIAHLEARPPKG